MYDERKINLMCSAKDTVVWDEYQEGREQYFIGHNQIISYNMVTTLNGSALDVYPLHSVLLNVLSQFPRCLIWSCSMVIAVLPVIGSSSGEVD